MILDTSALIAILHREEEAEEFMESMADASGDLAVSAASFLEASIVVSSKAERGSVRHLDALLDRFGVRIIPVSETQARLARQAWLNFGKGMGHPANLNFGDCFAYALARETGKPLLFKGNDFAKTDIMAVTWQKP